MMDCLGSAIFPSIVNSCSPNRTITISAATRGATRHSGTRAMTNAHRVFTVDPFRLPDPSVQKLKTVRNLFEKLKEFRHTVRQNGECQHKGHIAFHHEVLHGANLNLLARYTR